MSYEKRTPEGHEQLTGLSAVKSTTVPPGSRGALIVATGQPARMRDDGVAPTAAIGLYLAVGEILDYQGNLNALQFIETAVSATVDISYYS